ncbi:hypothetical protein AB1I62_09160 [Enterococcus sp. AN402]|uniref:hypothetical protein n=1 Tax=Enterococcus sp. AN402 TaxID=3151386 RepID=UPI00345AA30C
MQKKVEFVVFTGSLSAMTRKQASTGACDWCGVERTTYGNKTDNNISCWLSSNKIDGSFGSVKKKVDGFKFKT